MTKIPDIGCTCASMGAYEQAGQGCICDMHYEAAKGKML